MKKKFISILSLALCLCFVLTACGKTNTEADVNNPDEIDNDVVETPTDEITYPDQDELPADDDVNIIDGSDDMFDYNEYMTTETLLGDTGIYIYVPDSWMGKYTVEEIETGNTYPTYVFSYPAVVEGMDEPVSQLLFTVNIDEDGLVNTDKDNISVLGYYGDYVVYVTWVTDIPTDTDYYEEYAGLIADGQLEGNVSAYIIQPPVIPEGAQPLVDAIRSSRDAEENEYFDVVADPEQDIYFMMMGVDAADVQNFATSMSMMNVHAYCISIMQPVDGKMDAVLEGMRAYVDGTKQSFEQYLVDQYEVAASAIVEQIGDYAVLVMCPDSDTVFANLQDALIVLN